MIVWGGFDGDFSGIEHWRDDTIPATNDWTATNTANAPVCPKRSYDGVDWQRNDRMGRRLM